MKFKLYLVHGEVKSRTSCVEESVQHLWRRVTI